MYLHHIFVSISERLRLRSDLMSLEIDEVIIDVSLSKKTSHHPIGFSFFIIQKSDKPKI
jgi:hypothetical protein